MGSGINIVKSQEVRMIPISQIDVLNPRDRNKKVFDNVTSSISNLGLKKPITVSIRPGTDPVRYNLACGQGRMEAYMALGQTEIPAFVIEASEQECMLISLVENIARRQQKPIELFERIIDLKNRGYSNAAIGRKINMSDGNVAGVIKLLENKEEGLIKAVIRERIPVSVAVQIAGVSDYEAKTAIQKAVESGEIRGQHVKDIRRLANFRNLFGKKLNPPREIKKNKEEISGKSIVEAIKKEANRRKALIKTADYRRNQRLFIEKALKNLLQDQNYVNLLRAVGMRDMPDMAEWNKQGT